MHEFKIIQDIFLIIDKTAKENSLSLVTKVCLRVGKLRQIVLENLKFAFSCIAKDTIAAGAALDVELISITIFCKCCNKNFTVENNIYWCPKCNNENVIIVTGKEIIVDSIFGEK